MAYAEREAGDKALWRTATWRLWTWTAAPHLPALDRGSWLHLPSYDAHRDRVSVQIILLVTAALDLHFLVLVYRRRASACPRIRAENDGEERSVAPVPTRSSRDDKNEGKMDRAKGRMKEAGGALTGDKSKKREGRSEQRKGKAKEKKGNLKDLLS
jgi:uncharacterized protein YjbJ (UPF0337 family)